MIKRTATLNRDFTFAEIGLDPLPELEGDDVLFYKGDKVVVYEDPDDSDCLVFQHLDWINVGMEFGIEEGDYNFVE